MTELTWTDCFGAFAQLKRERDQALAEVARLRAAVELAQTAEADLDRLLRVIAGLTPVGSHVWRLATGRLHLDT